MKSPSDVNQEFPYPIAGPRLNLGTSRDKIPLGQLWELVGVDGRFVDSLRRHPGFASLDYVVNTDTARPSAYDITTTSSVYFFKAAAIQKGNQDETLRGFVVGVDKSVVTTADATQMALIFLHYDTQDEKWYTFQIVDSAGSAWYPLVTDRIDVAVVNRHLALSVQGSTGILLKWKYNTGSTTTGTLVTDALGPGTTTEPGLFDPTVGGGTFRDFLAETGAAIWPEGHPQRVGDGGFPWTTGETDFGYLGDAVEEVSYGVRCRWFNPTRHLWSDLSDPLVPNVQPVTPGRGATLGLELTAAETALRVADGWTRLYLYRTIAGGGTLYLEQIVNFNEDPSGAGTNNGATTDIVAGTDNWDTQAKMWIHVGGTLKGHAPDATGSGEGPTWALGMNDSALVQQKIWDPFLDETDDPPQSGLMATYQDMMLMASASASDRDTNSTVRWSSLFTPTPENFPESDHFLRPSTLGHTLLSLVDAGEYAFGIRDDAVMRFHRSGTTMAATELYRKVGGTNRYGVSSVGQLLYFTSPLGLMQIDGTSGRMDTVGSVERLFIDDRYWAGQLSDLHITFDGAMGALTILNTLTEEMYILWLSTRAVTSLEDVVFKFGAEGPHPEDGGTSRAWWVTPAGEILTTDYNRTTGYHTMSGAVSGYFNGVIGTDTGYASDEVLIKDSTAGDILPIDNNVKGHYLHVIDQSFAVPAVNPDMLRGKKYKILQVTQIDKTGVNVKSTKLKLDLGGDTIPSIGGADFVKVSIAPVVYKCGFAAVRNAEHVDVFSRLKMAGMAASVSLLGGEVRGVNRALVYSFFNDTSVKAREQEVSMTEDTTDMHKEVRASGHVIYPHVAQYGSNLDFELIGLQVRGTIEDSDSASPT